MAAQLQLTKATAAPAACLAAPRMAPRLHSAAKARVARRATVAPQAQAGKFFGGLAPGRAIAAGRALHCPWAA